MKFIIVTIIIPCHSVSVDKRAYVSILPDKLRCKTLS